jgi:hypothetical protein
VSGAGPGAVLVALVVCPVIPELRFVVQSGAEQGGTWSLSTHMSMMWQSTWTHEVSSWARGAKWGQAGGMGVVWGASWIVVGSGGAGRLVPSSVRHVQVNTSA